jgi:hypothetical protein
LHDFARVLADRLERETITEPTLSPIEVGNSKNDLVLQNVLRQKLRSASRKEFLESLLVLPGQTTTDKSPVLKGIKTL